MSNEELSPERIGRYYDEWTARYRSVFGDTFQACRPTNCLDLHQYILERAGISDGERILDAGCGICGPSVYFGTHRDVHIDAVTVSGSQVAAARQLIRDAGLEEKVKVHLGDFHRLDKLFPPLSFDRVLFLESLSHAEDPTEPLRSVHAVLKPGGVVYIKDFFEKEYDTVEERQRVRESIERIDRTFVLKTPRLSHTVSVLLQLGYQQQMVEPVKFLSDNSVWMRFNDTHQFDLYGGKTPVQWCDWLELRFQKPLC